MKINADLTQTAVVCTEALPWHPSQHAGVERRLLERDGDEVARATSIVRYQPGTRYHAHVHDLGEEFLVLDGTFCDETGEFHAGVYVRNPPGSVHAPWTTTGCTILVKLRQFDPEDDQTVRIDTNTAPWLPGRHAEVKPLFHRGAERVALTRLAPGTRLPVHHHPGGVEMLVLDGELVDERGRYPRRTWLRSPRGSRHALASDIGCTLWVKSGHLAPVTDVTAAMSAWGCTCTPDARGVARRVGLRPAQPRISIIFP